MTIKDYGPPEPPKRFTVTAIFDADNGSHTIENVTQFEVKDNLYLLADHNQVRHLIPLAAVLRIETAPS